MTFKLEINIRLLLLGLLVLPLLIWLGVWQMERAAEKEDLLSAFETQQAQDAVLLNANNASQIDSIAPYTHVKLENAVMENDAYWLLDNRIQAGKFGYELLQAARIGDIRVLVNRGWLPGPADRGLEPTMTLLQGEVDILGQLVTPTKNIILDKAFFDPGMPRRIVQIDLEHLSQSYGQPFHGLVRLDVQSAGALYINWPTVNISPSKHRGYALQWFSMAVALVILLVFANSNLLLVLTKQTSENKKDVDS